MEVEAEAAEGAALRDDDAVGAACTRSRHLRGDRVRLVLEHRRWRSRTGGPCPRTAPAGPPDELRPTGEVGVEALHPPVVERQHVVLGGLDEEEPLQLAELVGLLRGQVVRLRPVVGSVQLPDVVVVGRQRCAHDPRDAVPRHRRPALVVDAAVDEHLEVLRLASLGRVGIIERVAPSRRPRWAPAGCRSRTSDAGRPAASRIVGATSMT